MCCDPAVHGPCWCGCSSSLKHIPAWKTAPSGELETKGHPDAQGAQVRSLWGLARKSKMKSTHQAAQSTGTGPAAAEDAPPAPPASKKKGWEKMVMVEKREILYVL